LHYRPAFLIRHVTSQTDDREFEVLELNGKLVDSFFGVDKKNALTDFEIFVELNQSAKFLTVVLHGDEKLFDSFDWHFLLLQQNPNWLLHELLCYFQNLLGHGSGNETNLSVGWKLGEDFTHCFLESIDHLICLIQNYQLHMISYQPFPLNHLFHPSWSSDSYVSLSIL
jgi:hypothetical protein